MIAQLHRNGEIVVCSGGGKVQPPPDHKQGEKKYIIDYSRFRIIAGAACEMFDHKVNNIIFLTLTTKDAIEHKIFNTLISKFVENLKQNYELQSYIWVAEYQERGAIHYHLLLDIPFFDIKALRKYYNKLIAKYSRCSINNFRVGGSDIFGSVIQDRERAVKYVCKYFVSGLNTKKKPTYYTARCYAITRKLIKQPIKLNSKQLEEICRYHTTKTRQFKYTTIHLTDNRLNLYDKIHTEKKAAERALYDKLDAYFTQNKIQFDRKKTEITQKRDKVHTENEKKHIKNWEKTFIKDRVSAVNAFENGKGLDFQQVTRFEEEEE